MNKTKIMFSVLLVSVILFSVMFVIFGHIDWEDSYQKQLKKEIHTVEFPGGYYHLYQKRESPYDPWTTHLDMHTNFQSQSDVFSYIDYQMEELNNSFLL